MATGSADRTVKIWGMDFADCHKSFVAHEKGVVSVSWVVDTHLFFSMGKDGVIKQWDADGFRLIQILSGHHDEINMGLVSYNGDMVCSVGKDKSIRLWERSEEVVVLEDEERKRREEEAKNAYQTGEQEADTVIPGINPDAEAAVAQIHPDLAANAAERLIDSIEIHFQGESLFQGDVSNLN
jgi:U3 small nucleolar RNA-associated protein 12